MPDQARIILSTSASGNNEHNRTAASPLGRCGWVNAKRPANRSGSIHPIPDAAHLTDTGSSGVQR
jgi:hypothetical protein